MGPLFRTVKSIQTLLYKILSSLKRWTLSILGKSSTTESFKLKRLKKPKRFGFRPVRPTPRHDPMEIIPGYWDARNLCFIEDPDPLEVRSATLQETAEAGRSQREYLVSVANAQGTQTETSSGPNPIG